MILADLLERYSVPFVDHTHRHGRAGWLQVDCPDCGPATRKFHLGLSIKSPAANCWRCGKKRFWLMLRHYLTSEALAQLDHGRGVAVSSVSLAPVGKYTPPPGVGPLSPAHVAYLAGRGMDAGYAALVWHAGGITLSSRLPWRVFLPIHYRGTPVSWTTRTIGSTEKKKYISAMATEEKIPHKELLYGLDYCQAGTVVVHEGPLDVWRIGPGSVCTFGTHYTESQVALLSGFTRRIICFDNSSEAQARADALCEALAPWPGITERVTLTSDDPGSATPEERDELRRYAGLEAFDAI